MLSHPNTHYVHIWDYANNSLSLVWLPPPPLAVYYIAITSGLSNGRTFLSLKASIFDFSLCFLQAKRALNRQLLVVNTNLLLLLLFLLSSCLRLRSPRFLLSLLPASEVCTDSTAPSRRYESSHSPSFSSLLPSCPT
jgi:hypothetical protein